MKKRAVFFFIITLFAFCGLITRVYHLTNNGLENAAEQQATTTVVAANSRGTIYDCRLRPLVNTGVEYRACIAPFPEPSPVCLNYYSRRPSTNWAPG